MEITVQLLLDGCRFDYLKHTVFLKEKAKDAYLARTEETFGFQTRPAFLAGVYPETSQICHAFLYSPETSPFQLFRWFKVPGLIRKNIYIDFAFRIFISRFFRKITPHSALKRYGTIEKIPYDLLPFFDFAEKKLPWEQGYIGIPTIFDIFKQYGKTWFYLGWPTGIAESMVKKGSFKRKILERDYDFMFFQFWTLDKVGHRYGPLSVEIREAVKEIDRQVEKIYKVLQTKYEQVNMIIFADHGMVQVVNRIDVWNALQDLPLELGKDYVVFLDSSMARFWFMNRKAEDSVRDLLTRLGHGRILTAEDDARYRVRFGHNRYWDLLWLADPGTLIFPNFYQWWEPGILGLHGCELSHPDNQGLFMMLTDKEMNWNKREVVHLVDICPTTLKFMGLPIPATVEGRSVVL